MFHGMKLHTFHGMKLHMVGNMVPAHGVWFENLGIWSNVPCLCMHLIEAIGSWSSLGAVHKVGCFWTCFS
jgi:hypothetical protein